MSAVEAIGLEVPMTTLGAVAWGERLANLLPAPTPAFRGMIAPKLSEESICESSF